jgi:hypothetical protein
MKRILVIAPLAALLMGNQKCEEAPQVRELKRRVEMGSVKAPEMYLPDGKKFDFKFVANAQLYDVLRKTNSFSTSTMDGTFQLEEMTDADRQAFNRCDDDILNPNGSQKMQKPGSISVVATCMINQPQAVIQGSILNFEVTNKAGVNFNLFNPVGFGLNLDVAKATLAMAYNAEDPYIPGHVLAATTAKANRFETSVGATINFGNFGLGPKFYFKSELSGVVSKAMQSGITDLKSQMDQNSPWYATVLRNCDQAILINAGGAADAGLQPGDVLEVYNIRYQWKGEVCNSELAGSVPATPFGSPIAVAQVVTVGDTISEAKIIEQTVTKIQPGSRVYIRKLIQPVAKAQGQ